MRIVNLMVMRVAKTVVNNRLALWGPYPDSINVDYEVVSDHIFDIHDCKEDDSVVCAKGTEDRAATYINGVPGSTYNLMFVKYEEFLEQFRISPAQDWAKGLGRVDYIVVVPDSNRLFMLHEVSIGTIKNKEKKAKKQFLDTIKFLMKVPEMKAYIDGHSDKQCYVSARGCDDIKPSPRGVAAGFGRIYKIMPNPYELKIKALNDLGFTAWEGNIVKIV